MTGTGSISSRAYRFAIVWRHRKAWTWSALFLLTASGVSWLVRGYWPQILWFIYAWFWMNLVGFLPGLVVVGASFWLLRTARVRWRQRRSGAATLTAEDLREERQNLAMLRKQWPKACKGQGVLDLETGSHPRLQHITPVNPGTFTADVDLAEAGHADDAIEVKARKIGSVLRCRELIVKPGKPEPGWCQITFHFRDAIGRVTRLAELPPPVSGRLTYGMYSDGTGVSDPLEESLLIVGVTGSGKSTIAQAQIASALIQRIPTRLYIADPKKQEFVEYSNHVGVKNGIFEVRRYENTITGGEDMFTSALGALEKRQSSLAERRIRKWTPTEEDPLVIILVDDLLRFTDTLSKGTKSALSQIVTLGRAAGYRVIAMSQVAQKSEIGQLKSVIPNVVCLRTRTNIDTDVVLGLGATAAGANCRGLEPGVGYAYQEGDLRAKRFRAALVTDEDVKYLAQGQLPPEVLSALSEAEEAAAAEPVEKGRPKRRGELYRFYFDRPEWWLEHWPHLMEKYGWGAYGPPTDHPAYIGKSTDSLRRAGQHDEDARIFTQGPYRLEVEPFETERAALVAEKLAIENERPFFNKQHNWKNPLRKVDQRVEQRLSRRRETVG